MAAAYETPRAYLPLSRDRVTRRRIVVVGGGLMGTATAYADDEGHPYVDFQPALRFVPTKETNLYLKDGAPDLATIAEILYCNADALCVDESVSDSTLQTHRVGTTGILVRRIKHFSGYTIGLGEDYPDGVITSARGARDASSMMVRVPPVPGSARRTSSAPASIPSGGALPTSGATRIRASCSTA